MKIQSTKSKGTGRHVLESVRIKFQFGTRTNNKLGNLSGYLNTVQGKNGTAVILSDRAEGKNGRSAIVVKDAILAAAQSDDTLYVRVRTADGVLVDTVDSDELELLGRSVIFKEVTRKVNGVEGVTLYVLAFDGEPDVDDIDDEDDDDEGIVIPDDEDGIDLPE